VARCGCGVRARWDLSKGMRGVAGLKCLSGARELIFRTEGTSQTERDSSPNAPVLRNWGHSRLSPVLSSLPVLCTCAQAALHRVLMNISKLFHKLRFIPNIEIIIALLPERLGLADQSPRYSLLQ
jgi:hypothetical protein